MIKFGIESVKSLINFFFFLLTTKNAELRLRGIQTAFGKFHFHQYILSDSLYSTLLIFFMHFELAVLQKKNHYILGICLVHVLGSRVK